MANKMTKKDYYAQLREIVVDNAELTAFIDHEVELLDKKSSSKTMTATQKENVGIKETIIDILKEYSTPTRIMDMQKDHSDKLGGYTIPKLSALIKQLVADGRVNRTEVKGTAYFKVVAEDNE